MGTHPRWFGFMFWSLMSLVLLVTSWDDAPKPVKLALVLVSGVMMFLGIVTAPEKKDA